MRVVAALAFVALAVGAPVVIENGLPFYDVNGELVHSHGGGLIKVDQYYYWFGEGRRPDNKFRAVDAYRSTDLKTWVKTNACLTEDSDPELKDIWIERPKVVYNRLTDMYVMWMHWENGIHYGEARAAVAVSPTVDGDYKYLGSFRPFGEHMSRDITVFVDDDERAYMSSASRENADLHIYRLTPDYTDTEELVADPWHAGYRESPAIIKRNGIYFMLTSGLTGWAPNQQQYATATNITGPWTGMQNVGDSTCFGSQTAYILPVTGESTGTTEYLYLGDRWGNSFGGSVIDSRYVWLPITFPTDTSMEMKWSPELVIDTDAGTVRGIPASYYTLRARHSNRCADIVSASLWPGAEIKQYDCWGPNHQSFWIRQVEGTPFHELVALSSSFCVQEGDDGAYLTHEYCTGEANQQWEMLKSGDYFIFRSRASNLCLDVANAGLGNGEGIRTFDCNGQPNQQWTVTLTLN